MNTNFSYTELSNDEPIKSYREQMDEAGKEIVYKALLANRYNRTKTAEKLGVDRRTMYNLMQRYGL